MSTHRLINWLLALAIATVLAISFHLDEPPVHTGRTPEQLAQDYCGMGAALEFRDDGELTCRMHSGRGDAVMVARAKP